MTKHEIREVFIHSIAEQYKNHGELIPPWLHIGDIEFEVEEQEPVIDKIRAEIDNALSDGMIHKKTVLGSIDKYKAESEEAADE